MRRAQGSLLLAISFLVVLVLTGCSRVGPETRAGEPPPYVLGTLGANLYIQTAAEYRACCYTIYAAAGFRLEELLRDADPPPAHPAVVMDLDQTVLDNPSFQTFLYVNGLEYTSELWSRFERECVDEVGLVPGAKRFIEGAQALGVTVIYLSNRNERNLRWTMAAMAQVGIDTTGLAERTYLKPQGASSDKSPRREAVRAKYDVLMYLGDNLRDFSEVFAAPDLDQDATTKDYLQAIEERWAAVDDAIEHWGMDWFVLPNPAYGEWEELVSPLPEGVLRHSSMTATPVSE